MEAILSYLVKSIISSGLLTAGYWFFLRNRYFHQYNRFYLLSSIIISLFLPSLRISWHGIPAISHGLDFSPETLKGTGTLFMLERFLFLSASLVSIYLLTVFAFKIGRIYSIKRSHKSIRMEGFHWIETDLKQAPFTFLDNLFWKASISIDDEIGKKIFNHELTHIREGHAYDKLLAQIVTSIFWINPFFRIIANELSMVHEFIADENCLQQGDSESFAKMLLLVCDSTVDQLPSQGFYQSPVKRRLNMITTKKNQSLKWIKLVAVPLICSLTMLVGSTTTDGESKKSKDDHVSMEIQAAAKIAAEQKQLENNTPSTIKRNF